MASSESPQFLAVLVCRDEADVLGECLEETLKWANGVWIFDTGSTDGTWEIVQTFAQRDPRVHPIARQPVVFQNSLRGWVFEQMREHARDGDWILRIDADEFYPTSPPDFVRQSLRAHESMVHRQCYDFKLLQTEVDAYPGDADILERRAVSVRQRMRACHALTIFEPRMFRYRSTMKWSPNNSFPFFAGYAAKERIPVFHYPHRDRLQLQARARLRAVMARVYETEETTHWKTEDWQKFVFQPDDPSLLHWPENEPFPHVTHSNHIPPLHKRLVQRLIYGSPLVRMLDQRKTGFTPDYAPTPLPPDIQAELAANS